MKMKMKTKNIFLLLAITVTLLSSCTKDEEILSGDFTALVTGESPNATVIITNSSTGASSYKWTFGQGANRTKSSAENPVELQVDKAGEFKIQLTVVNGSSTESITKTVLIKGVNGINTFNDVEFAQSKDDTDYGRFFSISEGRILKTTEINKTTGPSIDLVYFGSLSSFITFESPNNLLLNADINIPGAVSTKITNYQQEFNPAIFDAMTDDEALKNLEIKHDQSIIGSLKFPLVVLFENAQGLKGAIKLKTINVKKLVVDIKVQKY